MFRDRWALVTGAARGIGRATAELLVNRGVRLVLCDVEHDPLEELGHTLRARQGTVLTYRVDVGDREAMRAFAEWTLERVDAIDLLVNNAGVLELGGIEDTPWSAWEHVIRVNLWGVIHGCRYFVPAMRKQGRGRVVNVASCAGEVGVSSLLAYTTTKFGVVGFSQAMRAELAKEGVGVSVVCPGLVSTNIVDQDRFEGELRSKLRGLLQRHGLPPEKVARAIVDAAEHNRAVVPVGAQAHAIHWAGRVFPGSAPNWLKVASASKHYSD
jgi:NAD(P)-dependent dehydrogenase (short-subunit alcohol dehydrogenase family)